MSHPQPDLGDEAVGLTAAISWEGPFALATPALREVRAGFRLGPLIIDVESPGGEGIEKLMSWYGDHRCEPSGQAVLRFLPPEFIPDDVRKALAAEALDRDQVGILTESPVAGGRDVALSGRDFRALIDVIGRRGRALLLSDDRRTMDTVVRIAASLFLPGLDALLVHGSSFELNGRGIAAMGPSGSGKTTLSRLSGRTILADEISLLALTPAGTVTVGGTPFAKSPAPAPRPPLSLGKLLVLAKDNGAFLEPIPTDRQMPAFLRNIIHYGPDAAGFDRVAGLAARILDSRPLERLHFAENPSFLEVLS